MSDTREIFDHLTEALNRHDPDAIAREYAVTAVVTSPEGRFEGRDQAAAYLGSFIAAFPDFRVDVWSKVTSGELVCDEWTFTGTNTGELPMPDGTTVPATGRRVSVRGCDIAAVENGEIISHRVYYDQADFLGQLGLSS